MTWTELTVFPQLPHADAVLFTFTHVPAQHVGLETVH